MMGQSRDLAWWVRTSLPVGPPFPWSASPAPACTPSPGPERPSLGKTAASLVTSMTSPSRPTRDSPALRLAGLQSHVLFGLSRKLPHSASLRADPKQSRMGLRHGRSPRGTAWVATEENQRLLERTPAFAGMTFHFIRWSSTPYVTHRLSPVFGHSLHDRACDGDLTHACGASNRLHPGRACRAELLPERGRQSL